MLATHLQSSVQGAGGYASSCGLLKLHWKRGCMCLRSGLACVGLGFRTEVSVYFCSLSAAVANLTFTSHEISLGFGAMRQTSPRISHLVDPTSSYMLVSKVKPCMSQYECSYCETANGSLNQLRFI